MLEVGLNWDRTRIDAEYDPERSAGSRVPYVQWYTRESELARQRLVCRRDVKYGAQASETFDVFPSARPDSPVLVFIHGGYWRALSRNEFSFVAQGFVPHNFTVVVIDYSLCPAVSIDRISAQSRAALRQIADSAAEFNGDPRRVFVCGHSAGAQQVGMLLAAPVPGNSAPPLRGGIAISGLFDIRPLQNSWLQPVLQLDDDLARRESPLCQIPARSVPLLLSVGGCETGAFHAQSANFQVAWRKAGLEVETHDQPGLNHFEAVYGLGNPDGSLSAAIRGFVSRCERTTAPIPGNG
jgi:arylformamidase